MKYLAGIDEAGRGALAGPVAVGMVLVRTDFDFPRLAESWGEIRDSKGYSEKRREELYESLKSLQEKQRLTYSVEFTSAEVIDEKGITEAIQQAIDLLLKAVDHKECTVKLDGSLKAPQKFQDQETIIKGDELEPVISLASICAKVERDRYMRKLSEKYPYYDFAHNKGYGTKSHRVAIEGNGVCDIHRRSFLSSIIDTG